MYDKNIYKCDVTCSWPSVTNCHTFSDPFPPRAWRTLWTAPMLNCSWTHLPKWPRIRPILVLWNAQTIWISVWSDDSHWPQFSVQNPLQCLQLVTWITFCGQRSAVFHFTLLAPFFVYYVTVDASSFHRMMSISISCCGLFCPKALGCLEHRIEGVSSRNDWCFFNAISFLRRRLATLHVGPPFIWWIAEAKDGAWRWADRRVDAV